MHLISFTTTISVRNCKLQGKGFFLLMEQLINKLKADLTDA